MRKNSPATPRYRSHRSCPSPRPWRHPRFTVLQRRHLTSRAASDLSITVCSTRTKGSSYLSLEWALFRITAKYQHRKVESKVRARLSSTRSPRLMKMSEFMTQRTLQLRYWDKRLFTPLSMARGPRKRVKRRQVVRLARTTSSWISTSITIRHSLAARMQMVEAICNPWCSGIRCSYRSNC